MGIVHLAEARGPGGFEKLVVVKELKRELADDPVYTAMFLDEARLAARLSHRHIVQTNEVGYEDGRYFMALELLEGASLHQVRTKLGVSAMPLTYGVRILAAVLDALDHAHHLTDADGQPLGVVHRDVSPQNVFLTFAGDVKLIDFGVAKSKGRRGEAVTRAGVVKGSVPYMSPDHVDGSTIDRRADVFAVGVILREMLAGERLWGDADDMTILRSLIKRELPAFPESADAPAALRAIAERATAARRSDRFASAAAMHDELEAYLAEVDPRGSLDDLGAWLAASLAAERAAFREIVRKSRATAPSTSASASASASASKAPIDVWLPSCNLRTRYSGPPVAPAAAPPLPRAATPRRSPASAPSRPSRSSPPSSPSRLRAFGAGTVFAAALALAALGLAHPQHVHGSEASTGADRVPRAVHDPIAISIATILGAADEAAEASDATPEPEAPTASLGPSTTTAGASQVPAAVLREPLPPNPYDPAD